MMKDTIVLYPAIGRGHLFSMIELGKLILTHNPSFHISILIPNPPNNNNHININNTTFSDAAINSITFHRIPTVSSSAAATTLPPHLLNLDLCRRNNQNFLHVLKSISETSNLKAIVMDFLNHSAAQVTSNLDIPTFFYYTSGASTLCVLFNSIQQNTTKDHHQMQYLQIPGLPTISVADMPGDCKDPENLINRLFHDVAESMRDSDGIIINTFDAIEGRAIEALEQGLCLPEGTSPPVFCIGPVLSAPCDEKDVSGCLSWLDSQPSQSVVLLSFGSLGKFSRSQLKEIAFGLERSDQRFLWVVRSDESDESSLEELLPQGFLERTKEKGMVVRNWAPQAKILSHDSVGGFVTHCGWNSVLEAVCEGVPMIAWPLYAEQKLNRVVMVREMKVALELKESKDGLVSATELGDRVKELMDSNKGKEIRQRIFKMKISAVEARAKSGSSYVALNRLTQLWKQ